MRLTRSVRDFRVLDHWILLEVEESREFELAKITESYLFEITVKEEVDIPRRISDCKTILQLKSKTIGLGMGKDP